jgi:hypothetical protein
VRTLDARMEETNRFLAHSREDEVSAHTREINDLQAECDRRVHRLQDDVRAARQQAEEAAAAAAAGSVIDVAAASQPMEWPHALPAGAGGSLAASTPVFALAAIGAVACVVAIIAFGLMIVRAFSRRRATRGPGLNVRGAGGDLFSDSGVWGEASGGVLPLRNPHQQPNIFQPSPIHGTALGDLRQRR